MRSRRRPPSLVRPFPAALGFLGDQVQPLGDLGDRSLLGCAWSLMASALRAPAIAACSTTDRL
jgi:hypothetical protein